MVNMETTLKHHNQIELPQEICCKLGLEPGMRFEIEVDVRAGTIILAPVRNQYELIHKPHMVRKPFAFKKPINKTSQR